jgi:tetratricopeptide (TPR) repeat protein
MAWGVGTMDSVRALGEAMRSAGPVASRIVGTQYLAYEALTRGQVLRARRLWQEYGSLRRANGHLDEPMIAAIYRAADEVLIRDRPDVAVRRLDSITAMPAFVTPVAENRSYWLVAARNYARAGRPDRAEPLLARVERDWPAAARFLGEYLPLTRAEIALARGDAARAVDRFRDVEREPDGTPWCEACAYFGLARAFDLAGTKDSALAYYERYLSLPTGRRFWYESQDDGAFPASHKRLGELYDERGDRARAMAHYAAFVTLWKDADPDLQPVVATVRRRLGELASREGR